MEKRDSLAVDIAITALILLIACIGVITAIINRVDKSSGEITTENCSEYLEVSCHVYRGYGGSFSDITCDYKITVKAKPHRKLSNLELSIYISSEKSDFGAQTLTVPFVDSENPFTTTGTAHYKGLSSPQIPEVYVNIVSASGSYEYAQ